MTCQFLFGYLTSVLTKTFHIYALVICFPLGRPRAHPLGNPREPSGDGSHGTVLVFLFFSKGVENCLFRKHFFLDHGVIIPTGIVLGSATDKVKITLPLTWSMCENEQKACKTIGFIWLSFLPMKSKSY